MPQFISHGDFSFSFDWVLYLLEHFFIWSFQSGAPNPDGIIRVPGRILNFAVFAISGNIGVSYFYIFSSLIIAFIAFFYFTRYFLEIKSRYIQIISALFFAINPIFLGNLAKIGLVLAVAMLPLCLIAIKFSFEKRQLRYLLLYVACLNISLIHPYTFAVNLAVSGLFLLYEIWMYPGFFTKHLRKFIGVGILALLLHAYFILPIAALGTISKDVISDAVDATPVDYTALVDLSTSNALTGLSLSKDIFLDFNFYDNTYESLYFLGAFGFYIVLIGAYLYIERRLNTEEKQRIVLFFSAFLLLVALTTITILHLNEIIKLLISLPGGWAFRSPLKWQLYMPLALFGILVIVIYKISGKTLKIVSAGLFASFLLMNSFLFADIFQKILTPRQLDNFAAMNDKINLDDKTLLFISTNGCLDFLRDNSTVKTELNQIFLSKNTQVKRVSSENLVSINFGSYDYIMTCVGQSSLETKLTQQYKFNLTQSFVHDTFKLHANPSMAGPVYALETVFTHDNTRPLDDKYHFTDEVLGKPFNYLSQTTDKDQVANAGLSDVFEVLTPKNIHNGRISVDLTPSQTDVQQLYARPTDQPFFYSLNGNQVHLSPTQQPGFKPLSSNQAEPSSVTLPPAKQLSLTYSEPGFKPRNLIKNPSLEEGTWQKKVRDCYAYDNRPLIGMHLNSEQKTHGNKSLQLETKSHIACTAPPDIKIEPKNSYLLTFDYQSLSGKYAGYNITFDDPAATSVDERLPKSGEGWHTFTRQIVAPADARSLRITLYAYPNSNQADDGPTASIVRYDNLSLMNTPALKDIFYLLSNNKKQTELPTSLTTEIVNPAKKTVHIIGAKKPFYLASNETYHKSWELILHKQNVGQHIKLNGAMNAWYVDPNTFCSNNPHCSKNSAGGYNFDLTMEFLPQRAFYVGLIISALTLLAIILYLVYDHRRYERKTNWKGFLER